MATSIGYQDGITALFNRLRDMDPNGTIVKKDSKGKWLPIESLADVPIDTWKAYDKAERAFTILKDDHDAAIANPKPPPNGGGEPPPQTYVKVAPRVANKVLPGGSDARFCIENQPGVVWSDADQRYHDEAPAQYDRDGLCLGGRDPDLQVPGLTMANSIDGRAYCSLPMVGDPTLNTGSWAI